MRSYFDSLTHPTLSGDFLSRPCAFKLLAKELKKAGVLRACAVGIPGVGAYEHGRYWEACQKYPVFFPVAGLDLKIKNIVKEIRSIHSYGYTALKIHPRLCGVDLTSQRLSEIFSACSDVKMVAFFCTYYASKTSSMPSTDPYWTLVQALKKTPSVKLVLVHGGCSEILRYADLVRANPNLLLDTSFTLMKYQGSSLDKDLQYVFEHMDRRICVGSDAPDFSPAAVSLRLASLCSGLPEDKKKNILSKNILDFLGIS